MKLNAFQLKKEDNNTTQIFFHFLCLLIASFRRFKKEIVEFSVKHCIIALNLMI